MSHSIISDYLIQRNIYLDNAVKYFDEKRYRKSSEFIWGAVTQTIKALAAVGDTRIRSHNQFKDFTRTLSHELGDRYYYSEFLKIERLHRNFYDEELSPDDFEAIFNDAIEYMHKLDALIASRTTGLIPNHDHE